MNLKEQLEILRGEPIEERPPVEQIPCIETSDAEKLCKHPIVSVNMLAYNHEPYIRQAIEGVMMQQTDFEFELVIGEDASQDKTREICFEYQQKYPDKIRVLWSEENVYHLGGNGRRVMARCRGEFIALCEGDDYWIDPLKLQKQVDVIRRTGAVMCVANSEWHLPDGQIKKSIYDTTKTLFNLEDVIKHYFHTTTYLFNREVYFKCRERYPEFVYWYDCVLVNCMATMGSICFLPEIVSVYNWTGKGIAGVEDSLERTQMLALQEVQFAACSHPEIAQYYFPQMVCRLLHIYIDRVEKGYKFSHVYRKRVLRVLRNVVCAKQNCLKAFLIVLKCRVYAFILRFPKFAHYCMNIKRFIFKMFKK